jgi:hypothetical protein
VTLDADRVVRLRGRIESSERIHLMASVATGRTCRQVN